MLTAFASTTASSSSGTLWSSLRRKSGKKVNSTQWFDLPKTNHTYLLLYAENRTIFCYASRDFGTSSSKPPVNGCNPFEGSPFREFWRGVGVADFAGGSVFYGPLHTDFTFAGEWTAQFSAQSRPVLAFVGAPSAFPTNSKAVQLQKYVHFSRRMVEASRRHRERLGFARAPYLAVHIRHGTDWVSV